jgi:hypothetical protein
MAKEKETKFTKEELKSLQEIQSGYQDLQLRMGGLKMQQIAHERQADRLMELEDQLMVELSQLNEVERKTATDLNEKYGGGSLDPVTGVFTKDPNLDQTAQKT